MADTRYYAIHIFFNLSPFKCVPLVLSFRICVKCIITQPNVFENRWFTHFFGFRKSVDNVDKSGLDKSLCLFVQRFKK